MVSFDLILYIMLYYATKSTFKKKTFQRGKCNQLLIQVDVVPLYIKG